MDKEKLKTAADISQGNVEYNDKNNHYDGFIMGVDWLMQQPLSERLTDEEKEKIIKKYNFNEEAGIATAIRTGELENKYILMRDFLEDFFGADLFKEC